VYPGAAEGKPASAFNERRPLNNGWIKSSEMGSQVTRLTLQRHGHVTAPQETGHLARLPQTASEEMERERGREVERGRGRGVEREVERGRGRGREVEGERETMITCNPTN